MPARLLPAVLLACAGARAGREARGRGAATRLVTGLQSLVDVLLKERGAANGR